MRTVKMGSSSARFGVKIPKNFVQPPPRYVFNHPIEKENHLPNLHFWVEHVNFLLVGGCRISRQEPRQSRISKKKTSADCRLLKLLQALLVLILFQGDLSFRADKEQRTQFLGEQVRNRDFCITLRILRTQKLLF